ncbi:MAG: SPASM domain-containing protein [Candidatus Marsarchaeota archaeon]|nr:SPASM domain-containing protein [Candidatus Marsarchaeota archaeon]MCL5106067.1 SPASM domain-containing protein [Candidatus Marsarchaeota archaeon]
MINKEKSIDFWEYKQIFERAIEIGKINNVKIMSRTNFPFLIFNDFKFDDDIELASLIYGVMDSRRILHILYDGKVLSTTYNLPKNSAYMGNIFKTGLNDLWVKNRNIEHLRNAHLSTLCEICKHFVYCRGGSIVNYHIYGTSNFVPKCPIYTKHLLVE